MVVVSAELINNSNQSNILMIGGRKPYFYSYDICTGIMTKVPGTFLLECIFIDIYIYIGILGKEINSFENFVTSPDLTKIAVIGLFP